MRILRLALPLLALAASVPATAQSCWPADMPVVLRDEAGAAIDPWRAGAPILRDGRVERAEDAAIGDSVLPLPAAGGRVRYVPRSVPDPAAPSDTVSAISGRHGGPCWVQLEEITVVRGGRRMRLVFKIDIDTNVTPGPSQFIVDTPPFAEGTWTLAPLPRGEIGGYAVVPATRWTRTEPATSAH